MSHELSLRNCVSLWKNRGICAKLNTYTCALSIPQQARPASPLQKREMEARELRICQVHRRSRGPEPDRGPRFSGSAPGPTTVTWAAFCAVESRDAVCLSAQALVIFGGLADGVIGWPRSTNSLLGVALLQIKLRAGCSRCQVESQHFPTCPSLASAACEQMPSTLLLARMTDLQAPRGAAHGPAHAASAQPELVEINSVITLPDCHAVYLYHLGHRMDGFSVS